MPLLPRPPANASLVVDLARIVGAQHVSNLDVDRLAYSHDCWPRDLLRIRAGEVGAAPACVVWPESAEEVARVLQFAEQSGIPVVPFGAGSGVAGGARPTEGGIVLDLKRMRAIRSLDRESLRAEVEAGIIGERLERQLNRDGLTLGHFPSSILCSTLGGWLAARSAGQMSTLYGKIEDMTFGLEVVTPGKIRRQMVGPRPPVGADWNALVIGSEGIFGAITAAELRLRPLPASRAFLGLRFPNVSAGLEAIRKILRANVRPAVVRLYDALDTLMGRGHGKDDEAHDEVGSYDQLVKQAGGFFDELAKKLPGLSGGRADKLKGTLLRGAVQAVLGSPLMINRALEVLPEDCLLVLIFEGQPGLVQAELALAKEVARAEQAEDLGPGPGEHWLKNRYNVSFKQSKMYASGLFIDTMEVASTWDRLLPMYKGVRRAIGKDAVVLAHFSHAYPEGCSIYFTFAGVAGDPKDPRSALERYDRIWKNALIAVHESGGTISHHHGVGESKAAAMAREHGPGGMKLLTALKGAFDPKGVLNPGKLGVEAPRRVPAGRSTSFVPATGERGFPKEMVAAVGEKNLTTVGSRTVVRPPDESAVAAILRVAHARGISVVTDQTGFRAPPGSVQLDLRRLEGVARVSEHSLFVESEAGVVVERLERLLNEHQLTLGHLHPRAALRTVGAAVARNLLIRRGPAFGDLKDLCFAVRGLLANGQPLETRPVPRSATGPELDRALVGGQGRLGIITKATLRVAALPPFRAQVAYRFAGLLEATETLRLLLHRGVRPAAARLWPESRGASWAVELVAPSEDHARAQEAVVAAAAVRGGGELLPAEGLALQGRFDAVVEVAARWHRAVPTLEAMREAASGECWIDFVGPEGVTVVARVVDGDTRYAAAEAGAKVGGRVVAGSRATTYADLETESFVANLGTSWRDVPALDPDRREPDPYADVLARLQGALDPTGVFKGRE